VSPPPRRWDCVPVNEGIDWDGSDRFARRGAWRGCAKVPGYVENHGDAGGCPGPGPFLVTPEWIVDHGPDRGLLMRNAKPTTRLFPDESGLRFAQLSSQCALRTAHWQPATAHSPPATDNPCRGPGRSCVHWWTSAGKRPKKSHFFSLFGSPGAPFRRQSAIHKSFCGRWIELETRLPRASKTPCGTENPKVSYRFPLIVHYLTLLTTAPGQHEFTLRGRARFQRLKSHVRALSSPGPAILLFGPGRATSGSIVIAEHALCFRF
jgi:hypothetical protein